MNENEIGFLEEEKAVQESDSWISQKIFHEVSEDFYQRGSFSVYVIHAHANGRLYEGVGFSKARPEVTAARYDSERGKKVAKGRAIHDLFSDYKKNQAKS